MQKTLLAVTLAAGRPALLDQVWSLLTSVNGLGPPRVNPLNQRRELFGYVGQQSCFLSAFRDGFRRSLARFDA